MTDSASGGLGGDSSTGYYGGHGGTGGSGAGGSLYFVHTADTNPALGLHDSLFISGLAKGGDGGSANLFGSGGPGRGGALQLNAIGGCALSNDTFSTNSATGGIGQTNGSGAGGGINSSAGNPDVANAILWSNADSSGTGAAAQFFVAGGAPTVSFSDLQGGWSGTGANNINLDPQFADPPGPDGIIGTLDDNLRLVRGSPAIDAGSNYAVPASETTDLDGHPRYVDDPLTMDTGLGAPPLVDMGAYEWLCAAPSEARGLQLSRNGSINLNWSSPALPGGAFPSRYDVLRSASPADFTGATAVCAASGILAQNFSDAGTASSAFYLIRAKNACGRTLGSDSSGTAIQGRNCP